MTLEGWVPEIGPYLTLEEVVEFAFDYRGNPTIVRADGSEVVGYVFNRNCSVGVSRSSSSSTSRAAARSRLRYAEIATIKFTGKGHRGGQQLEGLGGAQGSETRPVPRRRPVRRLVRPILICTAVELEAVGPCPRAGGSCRRSSSLTVPAFGSGDLRVAVVGLRAGSTLGPLARLLAGLVPPS